MTRRYPKLDPLTAAEERESARILAKHAPRHSPDGAEVSGPETAAGQRLLADFEYGDEGALADILAIEAEARAAAVAPLEKALREVIDKHDAYLAAQNGDGHPDQSHDRELAHLTAAPGEYVSTVNGCAGCGGAQYGSESDFNDAIDAARALLSAPSPVREPEGLGYREGWDAALAAVREAVEGLPWGNTTPDVKELAELAPKAVLAILARLTPERPADEVDRCRCGAFVPDSSGDAGCGNCGADEPPADEVDG